MYVVSIVHYVIVVKINSVSTVAIYFIGLASTVLLSLLVVAYINKRYSNILSDLTKSPERAKFWVKYSNVLLILVPLMFAMTVYPDSLFDITSQIKWGIVGLVLSLVAIGIIMVIYISQIVKN